MVVALRPVLSTVGDRHARQQQFVERPVVLDHRRRRARQRQLAHPLHGLGRQLRVDPRDRPPQPVDQHDIRPQLSLPSQVRRAQLRAVDVDHPGPCASHSRASAGSSTRVSSGPIGGRHDAPLRCLSAPARSPQPDPRCPAPGSRRRSSFGSRASRMSARVRLAARMALHRGQRLQHCVEMLHRSTSLGREITIERWIAKTYVSPHDPSALGASSCCPAADPLDPAEAAPSVEASVVARSPKPRLRRVHEAGSDPRDQTTVRTVATGAPSTRRRHRRVSNASVRCCVTSGSGMVCTRDRSHH